jgi:flagellar secretion chaperone FliS
MHVANPWKSYRKVATLTAPPGQIVLMLYEGALRALENALPGFSQDDPAQANMLIHNNLQRAQEIIRELNYALNMEQGGECAATLRQLYDYFDRRIWESNVRKRREGVDEVIRHLTVLRDAWATILNKQPEPAPVSPTNTPSLVLATA